MPTYTPVWHIATTINPPAPHTLTTSTGIGLYHHYGHERVEILPESAIISSFELDLPPDLPPERVPGFTCLSGSQDSDVGQLIGVDGQNITHRRGDHFSVVVGNTLSPGMVRVRPAGTNFPIGTPLPRQGVYTCRLPDETGSFAEINFGLYWDPPFYAYGKYILNGLHIDSWTVSNPKNTYPLPSRFTFTGVATVYVEMFAVE